MEAFIAIGIAAAILGWLLLARSWTPTKSWHEHFGGIESLLAILAIAGAASWYFVARPDAAKVKVDQVVTAYRLAPKQVIVLAEVTVSNVGARSLDLKGERYQYFIQKISAPLPPDAAKEVGKRYADGPLIVSSGDKWAQVARAVGTVESNIEAGEVENLYFRVVIPCSNGLVLYSTIWLDRPASPLDQALFRLKLRKADPTGEMQWVKQTPIDLTEQCDQRRKRK